MTQPNETNDMLPCAHCGKNVGSKTGPQITFSKPETHAYCLIACPCGIVSKTFQNLGELRQWWNTRSGAAPKEAEVVVSERVTPPDEF